MRAELHTLRVLLGLPALLLFVAAWSLIALIALDHRAFLPLLFGTAFGFVGVLTSRISRITGAGVWRLLPTGRRAVIRAAALLVLALSITLGGVWLWAVPKLARHVPLLPVLALFVHFSLLALPLVLRVGERRPRYVTVIYLLTCMTSLVLSLGSPLREIPWVWNTAGGLLAAIWLYACFGKPPTLIAPALRHWLSNVNQQTGVLLAYLNPHFTSPLSAANALLRTRQATTYLALPAAALVLMGWAIYQPILIGRTWFEYSFQQALAGQSWILGGVMLVLSQRYAAPTRALWLRWGDSRAQIFRLVERNLLVDVLILGTLAWLTITLLGVFPGLPVEPRQLIKMLLACLGAGLLPGYIGLLWATCHAWWQRALVLVPMVASVTVLTGQWVIGLGIRHAAVVPVKWTRITLLVLAVVVLRMVTAWCWNTIDWTQFRSTRRKQ